MAARTLCLILLSICSFNGWAIGAPQAHDLIEAQKPELLGDKSELVSLYYFGQSQMADMEQSVVGLERIGKDYLPIRWLLVFEGKKLLGWYYPSDVFPARYESGKLVFPKGTGLTSVQLMPNVPAALILKDKQIPFYSIESPVQ